MKTLATAAVVAGASAALPVGEPFDGSKPAIDHDLIARVNAAKTTWTAAPNPRFSNMTLADVKKLMGSPKGTPAKLAAKAKLGAWDMQALPLEAIPTSFDSRTAWPQCAWTIGAARDQSACGSCWAVSSTAAFTDRLCIQHNTTVEMSMADTTACCNFFEGCMSSSGCDGGMPEDAWGWFVNNGAVTGTNLPIPETNSGASCLPYWWPFCAHHMATDVYPACPVNEYNTPACPGQNSAGCSDPNYPTAYSADKHFAKTSYNLPSDVASIQTEIMARGSVVAAFEVYSDFLSYNGGVYQYTSGSDLGGHAVKVIGWGVWTDGTPYWTVMNSWNPTWPNTQMNGSFLILRGQDECGFEDDMVAGTV